MRGILLPLVGIVFSINPAAFASSVRAETACPLTTLETCRWELSASSSKAADGTPTVRIEWEKSIVSRHRGKPFAAPFECNVDRDFNYRAGGYIRVWFDGEEEPCVVMGEETAPACGVRFLFDTPSTQITASSGFEVRPPHGKTLKQVEHFSTLKLQCGALKEGGVHGQHLWDTKIGWNVALPGDGTYVENRPVKADTTPPPRQ